MVANQRFRTISDFVRQDANLLIECAVCDNKSVVDAKKVQRWFLCHRYDEALGGARRRFRCRVCQGRPASIRATREPPTHPFWMQQEFRWKALVKRLRGR